MNLNLRSVVLLGVALVAAGITAYVARGWIESRSRPPAPQIHAAAPPEAQVLVAKVNIPTGIIIKPEQLQWQAWPKQNLFPAYIQKGQRSLQAYVGTVARDDITAGEPITDALVVKPGEQGFLAAVLDPGMRAVTVPVNATSGIAGFIFPGDHVDLVLSHRVKVAGASHVASETVLTDIRVLAIDTKMNNPKQGAAMPGRTATLEVTPKQVEKINVARRLGGLSLSLRPLRLTNQHLTGDAVAAEDDSIPRTGKTHTWDSEVSRLLPPPHRNNDVQTVKLSRGDKNTSYQFRRASK